MTLLAAVFVSLSLLKDPGSRAPRIIDRGAWSTFAEGAVFATSVSETGPATTRHDVFSTNWISAGAARGLGTRGLVVFRVKGSLEPLTIRREGYPQLMQYVSDTSGGPLTDSMRARDHLGEASLDAGVRIGRAVAHVMFAPIAEIPLGPIPFERRESSVDFAEAPFTYDVTDGWRRGKNLAGAGIASESFRIDGAMFDHDSWSMRAVVAPLANVSLQLSRGMIAGERTISSASVSLTSGSSATTAHWIDNDGVTAYGIETSLRKGRQTLMARGESAPHPERRTHVTLGYLFDFVKRETWRTGAGVNVDYHSNTRALTDRYGHKPQSIYLFVRARTS